MSDDLKLPEPTFDGWARGGLMSEDGYTGGQMREYARAAILADRAARTAPTLPPEIAEDVRVIREALGAGPTPGPWRWWTSNSFRRLSSDATGKDGDVLWPEVQRSDNHGDIGGAEATKGYIAACAPDRISRILDALEGGK